METWRSSTTAAAPRSSSSLKASRSTASIFGKWLGTPELDKARNTCVFRCPRSATPATDASNTSSTTWVKRKGIACLHGVLTYRAKLSSWRMRSRRHSTTSGSFPHLPKFWISTFGTWSSNYPFPHILVVHLTCFFLKTSSVSHSAKKIQKFDADPFRKSQSFELSWYHHIVSHSPPFFLRLTDCLTESIRKSFLNLKIT